MSMTRLQIQLLGTVHVRYAERPLELFHHPRLQEFFAFLLLRVGTPQSREWLAYLFWPDSSESQARTNLRKLWFRLRQALPDPDRFLVGDGAVIQWRADAPYDLDVATFEAQIARACAAGDERERAALLQGAIAVYRGELLPGCYSDWLLVERERLRQQFLEALQQLVTLAEARRDYPAAIHSARQLLLEEPLDESVYRRLMELYALAGNRAGALRVYQECVRILQRELEVPPAPLTRDLYERLLAAPAGAPPAADNVLPLVGQVALYRQLEEGWESVTAGRATPRLLLLTGEPGIGKTRLAEELVEAVRRRGFNALTARCYRATRPLAYAAVTDWLRALPLDALAPRHRAELARLVPELLERDTSLPAPGPLKEGWQHLRFLTSVTEAVLQLRQPLLLFLDDLQWCDGETLNWLSLLLCHDSQPRLLLLATLRREEMEERPSLRTLLGSAPRWGDLAVTPLSAAETVALGETLEGRSLHAAEGAALYQQTEGNPLFVIESVREGWVSAVRAAPSRHRESSPLPVRIRAVVEERLAQLSAGSREVASVAAVIGRDFTLLLLAQLVTLDEEGVVAALDELWRRGLIRDQGADRYDFSHDKLREVAYEALSPARRHLLHRRVAETLQRAAANREQVPYGTIAPHFEAGGARGQASQAYTDAAAAARRLYAIEEALAYAERAVVLAETELQRAAGLLERGAAREHQGQWDDAEQAFRQAQALAEACGDRALVAQAQETLGILMKKQGHLVESLSYFEQARDAYEALGDQAGRRRSHFELAHTYFWIGDYPLAVRLARESLALARACDDRLGIAKGLYLVGTLATILTRFQEGRAELEESIVLFREMGALEPLSTALNNLGIFFFRSGDAASAQRCYEEEWRVGQEIGDKELCARAVLNHGNIYHYRSDYREALRYYEESLALNEELGSLQGIGFTLVRISFVHCGMGNWSRARELVETALPLLRDCGRKEFLLWALQDRGTLMLFSGDYAAARTDLEEGLALAREMELRPAIINQLSLLATVIELQGAPDEARALAEESIALAREHWELPHRHHALQHLGYILLRQGELPGAQAALEEALRLTLHSGYRLGSAICLAGLAVVATRRAPADLALALRLASAAEHLLVITEGALDPLAQAAYDESVATCRATLERATFATAWAEGQALTLEEVVALACGETERSRSAAFSS